MAVSDDKYTVFISHKHDDHALAEGEARPGESQSGGHRLLRLDIDITAGMDWRREIRVRWRAATCSSCSSPRRRRTGTGASTRPGSIPASTRPTCVRSFACSIPGRLRRARSPICRGCPPTPTRSAASSTCSASSTWTISDDWRRGPLAPGIEEETVKEAAAAIADSVPSLRVDLGVLSVSSRRPLALRLRRCHGGHPGDRAGDGRPQRHLRVHHVAVRPGRRNGQADLARPLAGRGRDRLPRGATSSIRSSSWPSARSSLHPRLAGYARDVRPSRRSALSPGHLQHRPRSGSRDTGSNDFVPADRRPRSVTIILAPEPDASRGLPDELSRRVDAPGARDVDRRTCGPGRWTPTTSRSPTI